jgi:autotransporter-associated beta strand protein
MKAPKYNICPRNTSAHPAPDKPGAVSATKLGIVALSLVFWVQTTHGALLAPYAPDADTLHLWHLDEVSTPVLDYAPGGTNLTALGGGAALAVPSYSGLGTAVSTLDGGQAGGNVAANIDAYLAPRILVNGTGDDVAWSFAHPTTGAFTFEALVRIDFDPMKNLGPTASGGTGRNAPMQIINGDQDGTGARSWHFRLDPVGFDPDGAGSVYAPLTQPAIEFINLLNTPSATVAVAPIPITGDDAIVSNAWFHVAAIYSGDAGAPDNFKIYWTRLDSSKTQAAQLTSATMSSDLRVGAVDFTIGNMGRGVPNNNFLGVIDEVRISRIARAATGMVMGPPDVVFQSQPVDDVVAIGQPSLFSVVVSGQAPFSYQWRLNEVPIPDATNSFHAIAAAQLSDAGGYSVVVTNSASIRTSETAVLTVRTPLNLSWAGALDWDGANINWDSNGDNSADSAYSEGDHVAFNGSGNSVVFLSKMMHPSSVFMNSPTDYTLSTDSGGGINRNTGIRKAGAGTLVLETLNSYTGATVVEEGVLQVGSLIAPGTIGSGPVTNNGGLVFGSPIGTMIGFITGTGGFTNKSTAGIWFTGTNTMTGDVVFNGGGLVISGPEAQGLHQNLTFNASANPGTSFNLGGGVHYGPGLTLSLLGTTSIPDYRCTVNSTAGTNTFEGTVALAGDGTVQFVGSAGGIFSIPEINAPTFNGKLLLRGAGTNFVGGALVLGRQVSVVDSGVVWSLSSSGNSWPYAEAAAGGMMRMGAPGVLPASSALNILGGILDLAGHSQTIYHLTSTNTAAPFALNPAGVIGSSSTVSDSTLTLNTAHPGNIFTGIIRDSVAGGTRRVGLTLTGGGTLILTNVSTYSGETIISSGTLVLSNAASIGQSSKVFIGSGAALSALSRTDATLVINAAQTLQGDGAFNVLGHVMNYGRIEMKANKTGSTLTNDRLQGAGNLNYGGVLKLELSGDSLASGDSFKLFDAESFAGGFSEIQPASPGFGLAWDTSTLAMDGALRVRAVAIASPAMSQSMTGGQVELSWPVDHTGWRLLAQTNDVSVGLSTNWFYVVGSRDTNRMFQFLSSDVGTVFYKMVYP